MGLSFGDLAWRWEFGIDSWMFRLELGDLLDSYLTYRLEFVFEDLKRREDVVARGRRSGRRVGVPKRHLDGIISFEIEYGLWVELQEKKNCQLRNVLQAQISETELREHVEGGLAHFSDLFRMKAEAAKVDVFHVMQGIYRSPVERFFLWIGGFRPSEIIQILVPQIEPLSDQQLVSVCKLRHSCQQAEDALSQGMEKLEQTLAQCVINDTIGGGSYGSRMASAMERLESLECFMNQADHLRQQTLQQMSRILTISQAARGLLAFGEYFQRLRALSALWAVHPHL